MLSSLFISIYFIQVSASAVPYPSEPDSNLAFKKTPLSKVLEVFKSDRKMKHKSKGKKGRGRGQKNVETSIPAPIATPTAEIPPVATPNPTATPIETPNPNKEPAPIETPNPTKTPAPVETPNPMAIPMEKPNPNQTQLVDCTEAEHNQQVKDGIITDSNEPIAQKSM